MRLSIVIAVIGLPLAGVIGVYSEDESTSTEVRAPRITGTIVREPYQTPPADVAAAPPESDSAIQSLPTPPAKPAVTAAAKPRPKPKTKPKPVYTPPDVERVTERIKRHPRTLWQNQSRSYAVASRGEFLTYYFLDQQLLTVSTDEPGQDDLVCMYELSGRLTVDVPQSMKLTTPEAACAALIAKLEGVMSR